MKRYLVPFLVCSVLLSGCTLLPQQSPPPPVVQEVSPLPTAQSPAEENTMQAIPETERTYVAPDNGFSFIYPPIYTSSEVTKLGSGWMQDITEPEGRRITVDAVANGDEEGEDTHTSLVTFLGAAYSPATDKKVQVNGQEAIKSGATLYFFNSDKSRIYSIGVDRVTENLDTFAPNAEDLKLLESIRVTLKLNP